VTWFNIIKSPYPNQMTNRKGRSGRRMIQGSGQGGLFLYSELGLISDRVQPLVDEAYKKQVAKEMDKHTKYAVKRMKKENKEVTPSLLNHIRKRVTEAMEKQKKNNLYATYYGPSNTAGGGKGKWFHGRVPALGVNPNDKERVGALLRTVHGAANYAGVGWDKPTPKSQRPSEEEE
jgi:hypothetical protein